MGVGTLLILLYIALVLRVEKMTLGQLIPLGALKRKLGR